MLQMGVGHLPDVIETHLADLVGADVKTSRRLLEHGGFDRVEFVLRGCPRAGELAGCDMRANPTVAIVGEKADHGRGLREVDPALAVVVGLI